MTLDPAIEAVARALFAAEDDPILWCDHTDKTRDYYRGYAKIAAEMIRAQVLEEAAQAMEAEESYLMPDEAARAIRTLKEQP